MSQVSVLFCAVYQVIIKLASFARCQEQEKHLQQVQATNKLLYNLSTLI